jgi:hypothetical protein
MWTCIVRVTGIMSTMIPGEGIQHACGQFEHAIDSVNLARVKRKEKKRGETWFPFHFVFCDDAERRVVATRERSPPPTSYKDGVSRASRSTLALCMPCL